MLSLANERQRRLVLDSLWLGLVGAAAAQLFMRLLEISQNIFLKNIAGYQPPGLPEEGGVLVEIIGSHGLWLIPVVTTLGGLIAGIMVFSIAPEAEGHGTDSAVKAFHRAGGLIRTRVTPLKMMASAITIGSGGAAGREGPTALIAAGIGSIYATARHRPDDERRLLVLIGISAGLSAIFRTPIGAAIFAIEVLYADMEFETGALLYALLASVMAFTVNGMIDGWEPLFNVPADLTVSGAFDYVEYAILGIAGGIVATLMPVIFYRTRDLFHKIPVPPHIKPAIGGLAVGLMALELPEVLGGGYGWLQMAMDGDLALDLLLVLIFAKTLAMSLSVASGGSGGVFAPSLFVGGMLGGVIAEILNQNPAAFVLVGMAAVFSGAGRVPIATLFMVTEMTGGYHLLAPAALVVALSYMVQVTLSTPLKYKSLYEAQIPNRDRRRDIDLLEGITVADVMTKEFDSVPLTMALQDLATEFERTHHHGFTVVDDEGCLAGVVSLTDLERAMLTEHFETHIVAEIAVRDGLATGYADETVSEALWRMGNRRIGRLPIVDRHDRRKLVGVLRRQDIIHAYEHAIANRKTVSSRLRELRAAHEGKVQVIEVDIDTNHAFEGKTVQAMAEHLPHDCILVSIRRNNRILIPHSDTIIQREDHLVILASESCAVATEQALHSPA
ncbi:MAG: chloride channel protein [Anaerolineae bacterium]|nr:chloride channel protein [Anaerolineae bacterium]